VVAPREAEAEAEEKGAMDLEKGVLKRRAFPISESHVLIVRRLVWRGREYIDIRFAEWVWGSPRYTKKGIRLRIEHLSKLVKALTEVADTDDLVEFLKASELVE